MTPKGEALLLDMATLALDAAEYSGKRFPDRGLTVRSLAKRRMAAVQAGRATVLALTPGVPAIRQVTILPRGGGICRIDYQPLVRPHFPFSIPFSHLEQ